MKDLSIESFIKKAILRQINNISKNIPPAYKSNPDAIHDIRVSCRRLLTILSAFSIFFKQGMLKKWKKGVRKIIRKSRYIRDLDVQKAFLLNLKKNSKSRFIKVGLEKLLNLLQFKRKKLLAEMTKTLNAAKDKNLLENIRQYLSKLNIRPANRKKISLESIAKLEIAKRISKMLKYGKYAGLQEKTKKLHLLRIASKKLRYALECFKPFYGKEIICHISNVKKIQRLLGLFRDYDLWLNSQTGNLPANRKDRQIICSLNYLNKECADLKLKTYKEFIKFWNNLQKNGEWKSLMQLVNSGFKLNSRLRG